MNLNSSAASLLLCRCGVLLLALCAWPAFAQAATEVSTPGLSVTTMLQSLFGLLLIVALLFGAAYLARRLNGGRGFGQHGPLKIVGALMISPRERIVLVEIDDTWVMIGVVPGQIKTLHTLPKGTLPAAESDHKPFGVWLKQMTQAKTPGKNETV